MRATYACGEVSGTSSSTSISLTTAAREVAWSSGTTMMPVASLVVPDHSIITGMPAVSSRRRRIWAWSSRPLAELDEPLVAVVVVVDATAERAGFVATSATAAVGALRACRLGTRRRTTGTTRRSAPSRSSAIGRSATRSGRSRYDGRGADARKRFYVETLGCPKNAVDSDKVVASLLADGLVPRPTPADADLVVVNTCAFIEAARQESIDVALALADAQARRRQARGHRLHGRALRRRARRRAARGRRGRRVRGRGRDRRGRARSASRPVCATCSSCPRPAPSAPWAYVKIAEGCDRACAFCAIPSFRGTQRSRTPESIEAEARALVDAGVAEIVLVAQDLAWYGRDIGEPGALAPLLRRLDALAAARPGAHPLALPLSVRGARPARRDDARAADGRAVLRPVAAARVGAAAAAHEAVGERRAVPRR